MSVYTVQYSFWGSKVQSEIIIKKKSEVFLKTSLVFLFLFFALDGKSSSVTAIPNESLLQGVVSEYAVISSRLIGIRPDQTLYKLSVLVESSEGIGGGGPDFLKERGGEDILFYSKVRLAPELFGKRIKAKARYQGDERGGIFWIRDIMVLKE